MEEVLTGQRAREEKLRSLVTGRIADSSQAFGAKWLRYTRPGNCNIGHFLELRNPDF